MMFQMVLLHVVEEGDSGRTVSDTNGKKLGKNVAVAFGLEQPQGPEDVPTCASFWRTQV